MNTNEHRLKRVLIVNAGFSGMSGLLLIFFNTSIAHFMSVADSNILIYIGIGLTLFSGIVLMTALRKPLKRVEVLSIIMQDWMWVAGSALVLLFQTLGLNTTGYVLIAIVAFIVADFALLQGRYVQSLNNGVLKR